MANDPVNSPSHYIGRQWECIDIIEALALDFHRGNALKYIARHRQKGGDQDIAKALWYLKRALGDPVLTAAMCYGIPNNYDLASAMTAEAIAANFDIGNEHLQMAIAGIRQSCEGYASRPDVEHYISSAAHALRAYLTASQAKPNA